MAGAHDAGSVMHIQTYVALSRALRFTGVQSHAYTNGCPVRPGMAGEAALGCHGCESGIAGTGKSDEESIALGIYLVAAVFEEGGTEQGSGCSQNRGVAITKQLEQAY